MSSILHYLIENHGVFSVQELFETDLSKYVENSKRGQDVAHAATEIFRPVGVRYVSPWESQQQPRSFYYSRSNQPFPIDIRTYDYLVEWNFEPKGKFTLDGRSYSYRLTEVKLQISHDQSPVLEFDLSKLIQKLNQSPYQSNLLPDQMEVETESDVFQARLYLKEINGEEEMGQLRLTSVSGLFLLKKK